MKVLLNDKWQDGFLDYHRPADEYRLKVLSFGNLEKIEGLYFVRQKRSALIWNYLREIGPREVLRKVLSRGAERHRNQKFLSCGLGRILEGPAQGDFQTNEIVAFLAPCHPPCVERIVLPGEFLITIDASSASWLREDSIFYLPSVGPGVDDRLWQQAMGWSGYSGKRLSEAAQIMLMDRVRETVVGSTKWNDARSLLTGGSANISETRLATTSTPSSARKTAILFGYGNYAKTVIMPNIEKHIGIERIHEIDPLQIPKSGRLSCVWDVSPIPRGSEAYDAFLIAGYHHTHAPLAISALQTGAYAVVEKPIATNRAQLDALVSAVNVHGEKLFSCFHKRYLPFNRFVTEDLGSGADTPISYHCIVYEVPLPDLHWYRWPHSKSRLISNGCHWVDHFLFLNGFSRHVMADVFVDSSGTINASLVLENGALFTMVLTDKGSDRIGVQDYIELRSSNATAKMINGGQYMAESGNRILRKIQFNKMQSYRNMYREIGKAIGEGARGDSIASILTSSNAILALEDIHSKKKAGITKTN